MQNGSLRGPKEVILPNTISEDPGRTPLHDTAAAGDYKALEALLIAGADRNAKDSKHGNTALHEAAWRGHSRCCELLCALPSIKTQKETKESKLKGVIHDTRGALHSALLGTRNFGGFSPLHLAAQNGHNQSCREILLAGGDPNVQNNYGDTPLHTACRYGHAGATRILLSAKCDHQRVNLNGDTPLHISAAMGRRKLTKILLEAGSLQLLKNAQDESVRDIALRKNLNEILEILDTPIEKIIRERERSSSSSRHPKKSDSKSDSKEKIDKTESKKKSSKTKDESSRSGKKDKGKDKEKSKDKKNEGDAAHWSPYGCHYFPDPRDFPSPKLETLPEEPLSKGEQYYLDLAGNIRKGPIGVGNTCYCAPFFRHLEERISKNKKTIRKYVDRATEKLDNKVTALALKTDDQIGELTQSMITERIRCEDRRLHLEHWLKRGVLSRATVSGHQTIKQKKDQANSNTITRCKSLELLDGDIFEKHLRSTATGISRSVDILDTHDVMVHRNPDYKDGSSVNSTTRQYGDALESNRSSDKDKRIKRTSDNYSDRVRGEYTSSLSDKGRKTDSDRDRNSMSDQSRLRLNLYSRESEQSSSFLESDLGRDSAGGQERDHHSNSRASDDVKDQKYVKLKVTDRLEELLVKTSEIIEMERVSRRKNKDIQSINSHEKVRKRDKLKVSLTNKSSNNYERNFIEQLKHGSLYMNQSNDFEDSAFIAHEMEKITSSLLGTDLSMGKQQTLKTANQNVENELSDSPEIAKENNNLKEARSLDHISNDGYSTGHEYHKRNSANLGSMASIYVPDFNREKRPYREPDDDIAQEFSASFSESELQDNLPHEEIQNEYFLNTFYQNDCFEEDIPSSSNNTLKSVKYRDNWKSQSGIVYQNNNELELPTVPDIDIDDRGELSEMANFKELNELKSRILNGSHWRSQVLKRSAQEYSLGNSNGFVETEPNQTQSENEVFKRNQIQNGIPIKYEIKNSEIKNLKLQIPNNDLTDGPKNKVQELVAKIQGKSQLTSFPQSIPSSSVDFERPDDSESSEDEEEMNFETSGNSIANGINFYPAKFNGSPIVVKSSEYSNMEYWENGNGHEQAIIEENTMMFPRAQPQIANYRTGLSQTKPLQDARIIDTRSLIPKDAYFHELPNRNQINKPILDNLPEKDMNIFQNQMNGLNITGQNFNARNRNPLPIHLNKTEGDYSDQFLPVVNYNVIKERYIPSAINCEQNRPIKIFPQHEKLLTNRKFGYTNMIDVELSRIHSQFDISSNASTAVSRETITIDQAQIERDMHNDSGYSTKICGSSEGASPSLSAQIEPELNNKIIIDDRNLIGKNTNYNEYYLTNIGASSLV